MADIQKLKQHVSRLAGETKFVHHDWFVVHHLEIIEAIVEELLMLYPEAEASVVRALVWVHDWGKIVTNKGADEDEVTRREVGAHLPGWGFEEQEVGKILEVYEEMESLKPLGADFLIETRIISSADAFSHYIGPFFALYWRENPGKSVELLIQDNMRKLLKDDKKLLLPEVRRAAEERMCLLREYDPKERPQRYLGRG